MYYLILHRNLACIQALVRRLTSHSTHFCIRWVHNPTLFQCFHCFQGGNTSKVQVILVLKTILYVLCFILFMFLTLLIITLITVWTCRFHYHSICEKHYKLSYFIFSQMIFLISIVKNITFKLWTGNLISCFVLGNTPRRYASVEDSR